jgi:hypothetical protein
VNFGANIFGTVFWGRIEDFPWDRTTKLTDFEGASELGTIVDCNLHLETPLFQLDPKGRHMRSHP